MMAGHKSQPGTPQQVMQEWGNVVHLRHDRPVDLDLEPVKPKDWRDDALCTAVDKNDIDAFYPSNRQEAEFAKSVCALCPVRDECLQAGLDGNEWGIWGGTTETERRELQQERSA
jgi:WhiB family redox-sensing transcriptional regulator